MASGCGCRGPGRLDELSGQVVIGLGVVQAPLAIRAGLISAVGAELGAIALVVGGYVQGDQEVLDLAGRDEDGVPGWPRRRRLRPRRYLADVGAERVVQGAFVNVREVADQHNGSGCMLVVAAGVAVAI